MDSLNHLISSPPTHFMPQGFVFHWLSHLIALHTLSDAVMAFSCFIIATVVIYFFYKRKDVVLDSTIICLCFFIITFGVMHLVAIWTIWYADYWFLGFVKALAAVFSFVIAFQLVRALPWVLQLPSPIMLKNANIKLEQEIRDRELAEEKLSYLAYHDSLTGLPNRSFFHHSLDQILELNKRNPQRVVVLFIDLDRFKQVNDSFSHEMGDIILQSVAERLRECIRIGDMLARLGGDEFGLIILDIIEAKDIELISQKILEKLLTPFLINREKIFLSASIGISLSPENGETAQDLMKNADIALYQAKALGKNNFQFSNAALQSFLLEQVKLGMDLRAALEKGEFELYYQPKVELKSGRVIGLEALLRWKHPDKSLTMPSKFIPISEENGLIVPIGDWVLKTACQQSKTWLERGFPPISIAINVSARQFQKGDIIQDIINIIQELKLNPKYIEIEITEGVLMQDIAKSIVSLHKLKSFGVTVAIDDFGTGYSSFNYLKRFEVDKIKIDQSFINGLITSNNDSAIVKAIISMAHSLGIKVVAEGVETREQLDFLKIHMCDEIQGYYFGHPLPPDQIESFLRVGKIMKL
ncbi:MAG: EAL domain-containing protein [Gammaproteobacteria bacterium]|nr:EAL domain-containing protein [Gammaproteobacteria bacterium]